MGLMASCSFLIFLCSYVLMYKSGNLHMVSYKIAGDDVLQILCDGWMGETGFRRRRSNF